MQQITKLMDSVWQKKSPNPDPAITILGGVHGSETAGVQVVQDLLLYMLHNDILKGTLNLGIGNPKAVKAGKRFIEKDLNRCFGPNPIVKVSEQIRAKFLKKVLDQTDMLFDIHSTIKPSIPMLLAPNLKHPAADGLPLLGIPNIITGNGLLPPSGIPIYADTFVCAEGGPNSPDHGGFGVTIETGQQNDKSIIAATRTSMVILLQHMGVLDNNPIHPYFDDTCDEEAIKKVTADSVNIWDAYLNVIAGEQFEWHQPKPNYEWSNFDKIKAGTHFATNDDEELVAPHDSIFLFPKAAKDIVVGDEVCILAKEKKEFDD